MKKLVLLSFFIFSSCQTIYSDKKNEIDLITTGKWQIDYMEMRGIKLPFPEKNWVKYHKKGKFEGMEGSRYYVGKWEFDKKTEY